ncbi:hypothetical protein HFP72_31005 [Nocardiopsis sp. ARC36]
MQQKNHTERKEHEGSDGGVENAALRPEIRHDQHHADHSQKRTGNPPFQCLGGESPVLLFLHLPCFLVEVFDALD